VRIEHWRSGFRCRVSGVSSKKSENRSDTRHLKPMLREGFTTPIMAEKKDLIFLSFFEILIIHHPAGSVGDTI
jgi:hypothetical protein